MTCKEFEKLTPAERKAYWDAYKKRIVSDKTNR